MNREIKFRYRYTDGKNWIMKVFTLDQIVNGEPFEVLSDSPLLKKYKHVGQDQWTGLQDVKGLDIYEGDVISYREINFEHDEIDNPNVNRWNTLTDNVVFVNGTFQATKSSFGWEGEDLISLTESEVIGNIHQHPHLLK